MRLPLVFDPETRDGTATKDALLRNCMTERLGKAFRVIKRPGLATFPALGIPIGSALGCFSWETGSGPFLLIVGGTSSVGFKIYYLTATNLTAQVAVSGVADANFYFTPTTDTSGNLQVVAASATEAYVLSVVAGIPFNLGKITSGGYPTDIVPGVVALDGYTFVAGADGRVYNSNLNDATTWTGDYISAESEPDVTVAIFKHLKYVGVLGTRSLEFFYDAANPTGSPLSPLNGTQQNIGCVSGRTLASTGDVACWLAKDSVGSYYVAQVEGTQARKISTDAIDRILATLGDTLTGYLPYATIARTGGHTLYILALGGTGGTQDVKTIAYDLTTREWYVWDYQSGAFPFIHATQNIYGPGTIGQSVSNGQLYVLDVSNVTDIGSTSIQSEIVTPIFDAETTVHKFFSRLQVIGDRVTGSTVDIYASDDDYQTWTFMGAVDMSQERPQLFQLGSARRRAFKLLHGAATALRLESLEIDVKAGSR